MAQKREWQIIDGEHYESEDDFRAAVANELALAEHAGHRLGFGLFAAPIRQKIDGKVKTLGWRFESFTIPLIPGQPQQAGPLPDTPAAEDDEDQIVKLGPHGEERTVPESEVSDLMEQGWQPETDDDRALLDGEPADEPPEPAIVSADKYAE